MALGEQFKIKHDQTISTSNKWNCERANADHVVEGKYPYNEIDIGDGIPIEDIKDLVSLPSGTVLLPYLIEEKNISNQSSFSFSSINGNNDGPLILNYNFRFDTNESGDYLIYMNPNSIITNQYTQSIWLRSGSFNNYAVNRLFMLSTTFNQKVEVEGYQEFDLTVTGKSRKFRGRTITNKDSGYLNDILTSGVWKDTTTNVTSLDIATSGGTITGKFQLWKYVSIEI